MRSKLAGLGGWLKNSFIDYPGTVATVLFFSGCNLRCPYCHNKLLVMKAVDESLRSDEFWDFLEARRGKIDGVVISGGEPTLQPHLKTIIDEIRGMGFRAKLDTNGLQPDVVDTLTVDYLALDIKTVPARYRTHLGAGVDNVAERLRRSVDQVRAMGECAEVRMTVAPGIVDREVARELYQLLSGVKNVVLQPMEQNVDLLDPAYESMAPVPREDIAAIRDILSEAVEHCRIRGG